MPMNSDIDRVDELAQQLEAAKAEVRRWQDAAASLAHSAAEARAKNQGAGRGIGGALFGATFRGAMRRSAAASNAAIAKEVVAKRALIAQGKSNAQEIVRRLQADLTAAKQAAKRLRTTSRGADNNRQKKLKATSTALDLLDKLKEAHRLGLLTDEEFERKRRAIVEAL